MYGPGVADRSGELLGRGIYSGMSGLGNALEQFSKEKEEREKEEKFQLGMKKALKPRWQELGFESEAQFENTDTKSIVGLAKGAIESSAIAQHEQTRRAGETRMKGQKDFNRRVTDFMTGPADVQPPMAPGPKRLTPEMMMQFASESNLAPEDMYRVSAALENFAQSGSEGAAPQFSEDPVTGMRFAQLRRQLLPSGVNPDRAPYGNVYDPESGELIPGVLRDAKGALRNLPADRSAQQKKLGVDAVVEAEKALQVIDQEIQAYHSRADRAAKDKNVKPFQPSRLQELERRKARLEKLLGGHDEAAGGETPANQDELIKQANEAIKRGADAEAVRKRLKEKFGITLK